MDVFRIVVLTLKSLQNSGVIDGFRVNQPKTEDARLQHVDYLTSGCTPGQPLVVNDVYRGMVVSNDGTGKGFVLKDDDIQPDQQAIVCWVRLPAETNEVQVNITLPC